MRVIPRVDPKDISGLADKFVGLGKEVLGELLDQNTLIEAGEAQQAKGTEKLKALREQAKVEAHNAKAEALERKQRSAQQAKAS